VRGKGSKLKGPKVRFSQDRMLIKPFGSMKSWVRLFRGSKILAISFLLSLTRSLLTFDLEGLEKFCLQF
jgi:hypothetical protein